MHFELIMVHLCCAASGQQIFHPGANKSQRSVFTIRKYARNVKWDCAAGEESDKTSQFTRLFLFISLYPENNLSFERASVMRRYYEIFPDSAQSSPKAAERIRAISKRDPPTLAELNAF